MSQGNNKTTSIAALFGMLSAMLPRLVVAAQGTPLSNEEKHSWVAGTVQNVLAIGGAVASANNPLYAPSIDFAIKAIVAGYNTAFGGVPHPQSDSVPDVPPIPSQFGAVHDQTEENSVQAASLIPTHPAGFNPGGGFTS